MAWNVKSEINLANSLPSGLAIHARFKLRLCSEKPVLSHRRLMLLWSDEFNSMSIVSG
jgi:hypothetical protein